MDYQVPALGIFTPVSTAPSGPTPTPVLYFTGEGFVWTLNAPNPFSWDIQISANGTTGWTDVTEIAGSPKQFTPALPGYYRVSGYDIGGNQITNFSNVVLFSTLTLETDYPSIEWEWSGTEPSSWMVVYSLDGETGWVEASVEYPGSRTSSIPTPALTVTGAIPVSGYFYQVYGVGTDGSSVTPLSNIIFVPTLTISVNGNLLSWTWGNEDPDEWTLQKSSDGSTGWTTVDNEDGSVRQLTPPTPSYYRLFGVVTGIGQSTPYSNVVNTSTLALSYDGTFLNWTWSASLPAGWTIQTSSDGVTWSNLENEGSAVTKFIPPVSGYYRIFGYDVDNNKSTPNSNVVQVSL